MKIQQFLCQAVLLCTLLLNTSMTLTAANSAGSKPQWVSKGEEILNTQRTNDTYYFKVIQSMGADLQMLRNQRTVALSEYIGQRHHLSGQATTELTNLQQGQDVQSSSSFRMTFTNDVNTPVFYAQFIDEYWERMDNGDYRYYALFAVSDRGDQTVFDRFDVTRTYGTAPIFMSIIPGAGQLYKGNTVKGWCMLGGAVLGVGAIVFCENERASYTTKIKEQPKHAQTYKTKADNYETARNVAIGVTGALVVWSVIDAAVAPGVTRIKVRPSEQLRIQPAAFVTPQGTGFGASLCYSF